MVIDYSKWDKIEDDSDEEVAPKAKPVKTAAPKPAKKEPPKSEVKAVDKPPEISAAFIEKEEAERALERRPRITAMSHAIEAQKRKITALEAQLREEKEKLSKMMGMCQPKPAEDTSESLQGTSDAEETVTAQPTVAEIPAIPTYARPPSPSTGETELVDDQLENEKRLEKTFNHLRETLGLEHPNTLNCFFELFDVWIGLYRLNKCSGVLKELLPLCRKKGEPYELKAVQATAFTLWKQSKFTEALELFHEMEKMVGLNPALCENIGHTYNSMGNYPKADQYFTNAKELIEKNGGQGNLGGVLLGLGLVKERLRKEKEALPILKQALEIYQNQFRHREASLVAKAHMSVGGCQVKLDNVEAEHHFREAIRIFKITCGHDSPLTSNAMQKLATFLVSRQRHKEAHPYVLESLKIEGTKDAFNLTTCCELLQLSQSINSATQATGNGDNLKTLKSFYHPYVNLIKAVNERIKSENYVLKDKATTAVWYKWGGEHCAIAQANLVAAEMLQSAIDLFQTVTEVDCKKLMAECEAVLRVVQQKALSQGNPM